MTNFQDYYSSFTERRVNTWRRRNRARGSQCTFPLKHIVNERPVLVGPARRKRRVKSGDSGFGFVHLWYWGEIGFGSPTVVFILVRVSDDIRSPGWGSRRYFTGDAIGRRLVHVNLPAQIAAGVVRIVGRTHWWMRTTASLGVSRQSWKWFVERNLRARRSTIIRGLRGLRGQSTLDYANDRAYDDNDCNWWSYRCCDRYHDIRSWGSCFFNCEGKQ